MKFVKGKFKILILSDIHTPDVMPRWTENFISFAMEKEKPDLVVLLGDNTAGYYKGITKEKNIAAIKKIVSLLGGTAFACVFGNHDHEGLREMREDVAKDFLLSVYKEHENCLAQKGDYSLNIKSSDGKRDIFSLYFIDSGTYAKEGGYAYVKPSQIEEYKKEVEKNKHLPSYLFQHIIFPEVYDLMDKSKFPKKPYVKGQCKYKNAYYIFKSESLISGNIKEGPCPPNINSGQFSVVKDMGSTVACFFGHDHVNDFVADCCGIKLVATPSPSFYTYGNNRGVRVVTIDEKDLKKLDTRVIYYDEVMKERPESGLVYKWGIQKYERILRRKAK